MPQLDGRSSAELAYKPIHHRHQPIDCADPWTPGSDSHRTSNTTSQVTFFRSTDLLALTGPKLASDGKGRGGIVAFQTALATRSSAVEADRGLNRTQGRQL